MNVHVTFRHSESSEVLKDHITEKLAKFSKYFIKPIDAHVTLIVEGPRHIVEISLTEDHNVFNAREESHDMYRSLAAALLKIERQLKKHKEITKNHKKPKLATLPQPVI